MNEIKQVLRLYYERKEPIKSIARHLCMSKNTVKEYLRRFVVLPIIPTSERLV